MERKAQLVQVQSIFATYKNPTRLKLVLNDGSPHGSSLDAQREGLEFVLGTTFTNAFATKAATTMGAKFAMNHLRHHGNVTYVFSTIASPEYKVIKGMTDPNNAINEKQTRILSHAQPVSNDLLEVFAMAYMKHVPCVRPKMYGIATSSSSHNLNQDGVVTRPGYKP